MKELKFMWNNDFIYDHEEELTKLKNERKINFSENYIVLNPDYEKELIDIIKKYDENYNCNVEPNVVSFIEMAYEQCGIELENNMSKDTIWVGTEDIVYMLIDEREVWFTNEIQEKILYGDCEKELNALMEKMYKAHLEIILSSFNCNLDIIKLGI